MGEAYLLELQRSVAVLARIRLFVVDAVEELESQVLFVVGYVHQRRIGQRKAHVALVRTVVIHDDAVHHPAFVVASVDAQHVAVDTVVEGVFRDLYLVLRTEYIVSQGIYFLIRKRYEVVRGEEGAYAYQHGDHAHRRKHPAQGYAGRLDGQQLVVLGKVAQGHHRSQQHCQRQGGRDDGAAAPAEELQDDAESQALSDEFVDVEPEELHHEDEQDHEEDCGHRPQERLQDEPVQFLHRLCSAQLRVAQALSMAKASESPSRLRPPAVARAFCPPPPPCMALAASRMSFPAFFPASTRSAEYISIS